jgi:hypothetical protein
MFYTYLWLREDGTPYYAGKGTGSRAYVKHDHLSTPPRDRIILQEFETEQNALDAEVFLIDFYGRVADGTGCLRNFTAGGEGILRPCPELRKRLRESHLGHTASVATKEKMSRSRLGKTLSEAHTLSIRAAQTPEVHKKKSQALKNKPWTDARRAQHIPVPIISWYKPYEKWRVRESITGKHLGYCVTREEAEQKYRIDAVQKSGVPLANP